MRRWLKRLLWACAVLGAIALVVIGVAWTLLRGSLAPLDGDTPLAGLQAPVSIQRDALGVVTIDAASQADAMRALGMVHAQERYFEMDLMRRAAAGELSELFGAPAVDVDKRMRVHRLRARTDAHLADALGDQAEVLQAYVDGVNQGVGALRVRPWPYLLLRQQPAAWTRTDSILTGLAMYADLQDPANQNELAMRRIREVAPPALYALLSHDGSEWDAPLFGDARGNAVLPGKDVLDLRSDTAAPAPVPAEADVHGSNNFAVAGALTADGRAIVADDMHLGLRAPSLWFRVRLRYPDALATGGKVDVSGFSLPGLPAVVVGSNAHVAWGFTNSYIDTADFRPVAANEPGVTVHEEPIRVANAPEVRFRVRETAWGPILHERPDGSGEALRWTAQLPGAVRLDFADMARAGDLDDALKIADRAGIPTQNLVLADSHGRIAWRLLGARPDRAADCPPDGFTTTAPASCAPWPIRSDAAPALIDPPSHRLWTANGRVLDGAELAVAGDAGYDLGARGRQIRDDLNAKQRFSERDLLAIQLDDRAVLMERWYRLMRDVVSHSDDPALKRLEAATREWNGRATADSVSYRVARGFRGKLLDAVSAGLLAPAKATLGEDYLEPRMPQLEGVLWPLVTERPMHLLPPRYDSWEALLADTARDLEKDLAEQGPSLVERTWGERNTADICHPISRALPGFARPWLCMPADPLPGDSNLPRVQGPNFGASQRMVVSPGHEADGIIHMPGGQSGHPLSPFWGAGHQDWVQGKPTPFLPGPAQHTLRLTPAG
ncbi:penicillin acylase family protein [Stenotrophomonas aracearum]|jgi:penicillin amidase|uniref:Penicillin acylase family protein n=1 Tax=Stenotrophomonas aracearum TaxID=3003272 RepID=A0ABY9YGL7_9GAMM|nr:penicillin acylase family protein [Stenotrophomonas sp. A5588]WNH49956.1 penicillin acylase family protein [Stenotrophomonas sp. A5588]